MVVSRMMRPAIDDIHPLPLCRVRAVAAPAAALARRHAGGADPEVLRSSAAAGPPAPRRGVEAGIFAEVWSDVVVSDGALSQAVRTLQAHARRRLARAALHPHGVAPRLPVRVGRGGRGTAGRRAAGRRAGAARRPLEPADRAAIVETLVDRLLRLPPAAGTGARTKPGTLPSGCMRWAPRTPWRTSSRGPHHAPAVALMRDAAGTCLARAPFRCSAIPRPAARPRADPPAALGLRTHGRAPMGERSGRRRARRRRAGVCGGVALYLSPTSTRGPQSSLALAAIGALAGGVGAAGIGAGLAAAEVLARSRRRPGARRSAAPRPGALVGALAHLLLRALLDGLFWPAAVATAAARSTGWCSAPRPALGYALATPQPPGGGVGGAFGPATAGRVMRHRRLRAAPPRRVALALSGRPLVGGLVHEVARPSRDAELVLAPLGPLHRRARLRPIHPSAARRVRGRACSAARSPGA